MKNLHLYIAKAVTTISTFLFNIYLARVADVSYFGIFNLLLNITFIFNFINDWGFSMFGPLEVNKHKELNDKLNYAQRVFNFKIITTALSLLLYLATIYIFYKEHMALLSFGALVIVSNLFNLDWLLRAHHFFSLVSTRQIVYAFLNLSAVIIIYYFTLDVFYVFLSYGLSIFLSFLLGVIFLSRKKIFSLGTQRLNGFWKNGSKIFAETKTAFLGLFVFNLLYSFNIPLLSYFSAADIVSYYASYYTIFASVVSIVAIAQDIYLPKYNHHNYEAFFQSYSQLIYIGLVGVMLVLSALPYYYNVVFPASFKLDMISVVLVTMLGFMFSYRLLYLHSYMIVNNYRYFFIINVVALFIYFVCVVFLVTNGLLNQNTAFLSLIIAEGSVIAFSISKERKFSKPMLFNSMIACVIVCYNFFFSSHTYTLFVYLTLLFITAIIFYKKLGGNFFKT